MSLALDIEVGLNKQYPQAINEWKAHALACYPEEACGFVLIDGTFKPVKNVHSDPRNHFKIDEIDFTFAGDVAGFLHSHTPNEPDDPSKGVVVREHPTALDMKTQMSMALPWGLSTVTKDAASDPVWWGDSLPIRPLIGRPFIFGINDCYSLVRDWHRLQGLNIPDYPRDFGFWTATEDHPAQALYEDFFEAAGFQRVQRSGLQLIPGDCFLTHLRASVRNHAGVYVGNGQIIHHTLDQLSKRIPVAPWAAKLDFIVRHKDLPDDAELVEIDDAT